MLLTLITILGYPEWFTHFSSPQPSPPELNSEFWHPLVFSMGFLGAAEGIWQMASPHPSPPCPKLHFLCSSLFCSSLVPPSVSQFPAGTSMGALGGVWSMPRPRVGSVNAGGSQELSDLSAPSLMRLKRCWRSSVLQCKQRVVFQCEEQHKLPSPGGTTGFYDSVLSQFLLQPINWDKVWSAHWEWREGSPWWDWPPPDILGI